MNRTVLLLCAFFSVSFGCNCGITVPSPLNRFCHSYFVGVLTITSRTNATTGNPVITYVGRSLSPDTIFKQPDNFPQDPLDINIFTHDDFAIDSGACGVNWLQQGKTYLLNGNIWKNALYLHSCFQIDAHDEWANIPQDIKEPLQDGTYKKNCGDDDHH
ncbi:hypothetical protein QR680_006639 [Steinernema hermaphroditum]|uniref:NTR domain-containing protein n=1 Tax=Steinernema hermaphroditum TaxID=289476 RepID=A0AA39HW20_9BILA|nr:hypothetical protein QR680_006639 [Steinernema hermaphroditum]